MENLQGCVVFAGQLKDRVIGRLIDLLGQLQRDKGVTSRRDDDRIRDQRFVDVVEGKEDALLQVVADDTSLHVFVQARVQDHLEAHTDA